jgi:small subunit ribosomal protein S4
MGDPRPLRKKYSGPGHPWQKSRLDEEKKLTKEYALKNKKELNKAGSKLKGFAGQAKKLTASRTEQSEIERKQLIGRLSRLGLLGTGAKLDDVLRLQVSDILGRRLQTLVYKKGLARTQKQARQFITHHHVTVNGKTITAPGYMVPVADEGAIAFKQTSSLSSEDHPERVTETKEKPEEELEKTVKKGSPKKTEKRKEDRKEDKQKTSTNEENNDNKQAKSEKEKTEKNVKETEEPKSSKEVIEDTDKKDTDKSKENNKGSTEENNKGSTEENKTENSKENNEEKDKETDKEQDTEQDTETSKDDKDTKKSSEDETKNETKNEDKEGLKDNNLKENDQKENDLKEKEETNTESKEKSPEKETEDTKKKGVEE